MIRVHHRFMTGSGDVMHLRFQGMEKSTPNEGDYAFLVVFKSPKSEATIGQVVWENLWRRPPAPSIRDHTGDHFQEATAAPQIASLVSQKRAQEGVQAKQAKKYVVNKNN